MVKSVVSSNTMMSLHQLLQINKTVSSFPDPRKKFCRLSITYLPSFYIQSDLHEGIPIVYYKEMKSLIWAQKCFYLKIIFFLKVEVANFLLFVCISICNNFWNFYFCLYFTHIYIWIFASLVHSLNDKQFNCVAVCRFLSFGQVRLLSVSIGLEGSSKKCCNWMV